MEFRNDFEDGDKSMARAIETWNAAKRVAHAGLPEELMQLLRQGQEYHAGSGDSTDDLLTRLRAWHEQQKEGKE
jgi:hypothetical protein